MEVLMPVKPDQIAWLSKALGVPADTLRAIVRRAAGAPPGVQVPIGQAGAVLTATGAQPASAADADLDSSETGGFTARDHLASIPARAKTDADLEPPDISGADVDAAVDNNLTTGDLFQLPGQPDANKNIGLQRVDPLKADPLKPIADHRNLRFKDIKDAPGGKVELRTHSANANAPEGSYSAENETTQINTPDGQYRLPDGTWKKIADMTPEERAAAHYGQYEKSGVGAGDSAETDPAVAGEPEVADITAIPGADPGPLPARFQGPSKPVKLFDTELQPIEPGSPNLTATPTPGAPIPYELGNGPPPGQVQVRPGDGSPVADPLAQTQELPAVEPPPSASSGPSSAAADAEAGAESGLGGAAGAGLLGAGIAGGMAIADDYSKVKSGQMSLTDAAEDVGGKAAGAGGLTFAGTAIADAAGASGGADAAAVAGVAADVAGAALKGGVVGGVVAGGMALYDDVGKVESGQMTAGNATVDVTAKTAVGVAAGLAGAEAGAEIGAAVGSIVPGAGTAVGLVAGAVVGGAVGYVGSKLLDTDTGKAVLGAAGEAAMPGSRASKTRRAPSRMPPTPSWGMSHRPRALSPMPRKGSSVKLRAWPAMRPTPSATPRAAQLERLAPPPAQRPVR
jgi:hypothetical protein